jgi:hypothetical protein
MPRVDAEFRSHNSVPPIRAEFADSLDVKPHVRRAEWRNITSTSYTFAFQNFNEKHMSGLNLSLAAQF